ncbi:MMPL family transporter [Nocardia sp. ET3-3]|uniref:MMPL family transporter n=1 Tax=Nocardia terrae TaxID=2675851 RepID=A0A7K1V2A9_9NOCA|nr:MMPL family transporter [Nocardia terrae]MVU80770.1 MMPL family transporter [Nocardia terrae]
MSTLLYRIGRTAYRRPWLFIAPWVVILHVIITLLAVYPPQLSSEVRIDGTPAQHLIDDLGQKMPLMSGGQGIIAFETENGSRIDQGENLGALLAAVDQVYASDHVIDTREVLKQEAAKGMNSPALRAAAAVTPSGAADHGAAATPLAIDGQPVPGVLVSPDRTSAVLQFQFDKQTFELPADTIDNTVAAAKHATAGHGIAVLPSASMVQLPEIVGAGEVVGVGIAALVLLVTLGSLVAAGLPLVTALSGVGVGVGGTLVISHLISLHSLSAVLGLMIGLAVGIDYALFIVNRQRRYILDQGMSAEEATGRALGTSGTAVVFAGSTVAIALTALAIVRIHLITTMGIAATATVLIAVLTAVTLLPALLGLAGERICSPKARLRAASPRATATPARPPLAVATAWVGLVTRHRFLAATAALLITGLLAFPATQMSLGLPSGASYSGGTTQRESYEVVKDHFGPGYNGPLVVVADAGNREAPIATTDIAGLYRDLTQLPGVTAVTLGGVSDNGRTVVLSVVPSSGPTDAATEQLVHEIRGQAATFASDRNVDVGVTGFTALGIDVSARLAHALPVYLAVVAVLSIFLLALVFRSIVIPIKATLGFVLSILAAFGATTAVFQHGWGQSLLGFHATSPILAVLPIVATGLLYGLAMDYEVFLVSAMKEAHADGRHGDEAIAHGFEHAARVVVAAAAIMAAVFAGFIFTDDPMIRQFGFALAVGVIVDAFVVRMLLVPAVMSICGDAVWWMPQALQRVLPNIDIEGRSLNAERSGPAIGNRQPAHTCEFASPAMNVVPHPIGCGTTPLPPPRCRRRFRTPPLRQSADDMAHRTSQSVGRGTGSVDRSR